MKRFFRALFVGIGIMLLSSVTIDATLNPNGISQSAIGIVATTLLDTPDCPTGMALFSYGDGRLCIDLFESAVGEECEFRAPRNAVDTEKNIADSDCRPVSELDQEPWTFISLQQAQRLCAKDGKRLPTGGEWYHMALGADVALCNVSGGGRDKTGSGCVSQSGAYDLVGNVWEWIGETIQDGTYDGRSLPMSGYVTQVDMNGVALMTDERTPSELFGNDYVWTRGEGTVGMIRGGFYGGGSDSGLFSLNASVDTNFSGEAVGFRCVKDTM